MRKRHVVNFLIVFVSLAVLWQILLIARPCPGDLRSANGLGWCTTATTGQAWATSPPFALHYLSIAVLAAVGIGLWYAVAAAARAARQGGPLLDGTSVAGLLVRFAIALALLSALDWLVPRIQPCMDDFLYSPAAGMWCQAVQQPPRWPDVTHGEPLLVIAFSIVYAWYVIERSDGRP